MDQLSERNAKVVVCFAFLVLEQCREALREALQNFDVGEIPLGEPGGRHNPQLRFYGPEVLWAITDDHNSLLYGASCDLSRAVDQLACIQLAGT